MKQRILVTGGAGFIGSGIAAKLALDPEKFIVIVDNLHTGSHEKIPASPHKNIKFIKADVNDFLTDASISLSCRVSKIIVENSSILGDWYRKIA